MGRALDKGILIGVALIVATMAISAAVTYRNTQKLREDAAQVARTHELLDLTTDTLLTLVDAETGQRGFIITGMDEFLQPYNLARARWQDRIQLLKDKTRGNPRQEARIKKLEELSIVRLEMLREGIEVRRHDLKKAQSFIAAKAGKTQMDAIRDLVAEIERDERRLLDQRDEQSSKTYAIAVGTVLFTALLGLMIFGAFVWLLDRNLAARKKANAVIHEQREWLRTTVASIGDAVITTDVDGRVTLLNPVAQELTGWKDGVGQPLEKVFHITNEETGGPAENPVTRVLREGKIVGLANHTVLTARDGTVRPIEDSAAPIRDAKGFITGTVLVFHDVTARRLSQAESRRQDQQRRAILESISDAFFGLDRDWRFTYVNQQAEHILRSPREELLGKTLWDEFPSFVGSEFEREYRQAVAENRPRTFELFYAPHASWYEVHAYPNSDGLAVYSRNTTERRRSQDALRQSEEKFRLLAETIPQLAWMARPDGHIFWYNQRWYEYTGATPGEMEGWGWQSIQAPETLPRVLDYWKTCLDKGVPFEMIFPLKGKDGRYRQFLTRVNPLRDTDGRLLNWFGTNTDISELKELETAVSEKEARFRAIFEGSSDAIVMTDDEGNYVEANPVAGNLFGLDREALIGHNVAEFTEPGFPFEEAWETFRQDGHAKGEFRLRRLDGLIKEVEFAATADILPGRHLSILRDISERKKSERALREVETRFAGVINNSPAYIFVKDRQGRFLLGNPALSQLFGLEPEDFLGRTDADLFAPEVAAHFQLSDSQILLEGVPRVFEETFCYGGKTVTSVTVKFPLLDSEGIAYGVCGIATDISAQKQASDALAVSEERLRLALDAGRMGVWDWNILTGEVKWSENLAPLHGLAPDVFEGTFEAYQRLIHSDDHPFVAEAIGAAVAQRSGYAIEFRNVWPDGTIHWIAGKGKVFTNADGMPVRMIGVSMDITDQKRSEQRARFLADVSSTLATLVDYESTLQKVARLAVPFFADWATVDMLEPDGSLHRLAVAHVDPTKVELAHEVNRRFPPDKSAPSGVWNILRTGASESIAEITDELLSASIKDPELLQIMRELGLKSYIGVPLKVRGKTVGVISFLAAESHRQYGPADLSVAEDLAHRVGIALENAQLYRALREADRKKDEFLAVLAHELRNPLAPLSNALQIMRLTTVDGPAAQVRDMMERQVKQMTRLVDDLLDVSRITSGKISLRREKLDLADVVQSALETSRPLLEAARHQLKVSLPPNPLYVDGDKTRLAQVLSNLLTNSAKYTPEGGKVWLTIEEAGPAALIRVRDDGVGIPPEMLPRIFDMFTQVDRNVGRSQGGLGIGLMLVRRLVEMHEGSVQARSGGPGQGSEFTIQLPRAIDSPRVEEAQSPLSEAPVRGLPSGQQRILVVDDNVDSAESLALMLKLQGYEIHTAHDGPAALKAATAFLPDFVLLDIGLPGMDGYEVAQKMRQIPELKKVVLIAQTGWGQEEDRRRSSQAGFDHHFTKPVDPAALSKLLAGLRPSNP